MNAEYIARFPPFECPPIIILFAFEPILVKYFKASVCDGIGYLNAILKSSFQPVKEASVPLNEINTVSASISNVRAENCFSLFSSSFCTLFLTFISL